MVARHDHDPVVVDVEGAAQGAEKLMRQLVFGGGGTVGDIAGNQYQFGPGSVLAGGESAVLVMVEAVTRLIPGVVAGGESVEDPGG